MDLSKIKPRPVDLEDLKGITEDLQSGSKRDSHFYQGTVVGVALALNKLGRGVITKINVTELQEQLGHLLYYEMKDGSAVPFDLEFLDPLKSHFKNPTLMVLKRIRRFLMAAHRKLLARFEEDQAQERRIEFTNLDINTMVKKGMEDMQRFQTMASLTPSVSRKLDILTKALHVPARFHAQFRLLIRIMDDPFHLRYRQAMTWLRESNFSGNLDVLRRVSKAGQDLLDKKSADIFGEMERISGIPFDRNTEGLNPGFNWFSLGTPLRRGEEFVRIFENEERVEQAIKRLTFFMVRASWDADHYRNLVDRNIPSQRDRQECCTQLAKIYIDLENKISESTNPAGEVQTAIKTDETHNQLSPEEAAEARQWVQSNKARLQELKLEVFRIIAQEYDDCPDLALPEALESMMTEPGETRQEGPMPKVGILDLHRDVEAMEVRMELPDAEVLAALVALRKGIEERKGELTGVELQRKVRAACADFTEYEEKLMEFEKAENRLDEMRIRIDDWIMVAWREVMFSQVDEEVIEEAFGVVMDRMLASIKVLDYEVMDADGLRVHFEQALELEDQEALFQLDQLLHEVHSIPNQNQILPALSDWENTLSRKDFEAKQSFVLENELKLQTLVDEVRAELRERIAHCNIRPRRLRFEVFSLSDCYAGNLRSLLKGLLRMARLVASEKEGERLISNIAAIEAQVIESQRITKPKGEAYEKLKELKRLNLLPQQVIEDLHEDLEANFKDLDALLHETNEGLERVRRLQNRFGGTYDTSHLSVIINIHDLESLKKIYNFVDSITMMDIKRFGVIYKQKNTLMADLYERAYNNDESVPGAIAKLIDSKAYKAYKKNNVVPLSLKTAILREMPEILEFESELLIRTLNLVAADQIRNKSVYKGILKIVEQAKDAGREKRRMLRRIWTKFRSKILAFKPRNFKANYDNNTRALITDVKNTVGSLFDDL